MATPRSSKLSGTVYWPDGTTLFQGYVAVVLIVPVSNGTQSPEWPRVSIVQGYPNITLPLWTKVRIIDGVFDQGVGLWYNSDLKPYGSVYAAYYYDAAGVSVGDVTGTFTVTGPSTAIPQNITVTPETGSTIPTPAEVF